jgi:hypothetical protein
MKYKLLKHLTVKQQIFHFFIFIFDKKVPEDNVVKNKNCGKLFVYCSKIIIKN